MLSFRIVWHTVRELPFKLLLLGPLKGTIRIGIANLMGVSFMLLLLGIFKGTKHHMHPLRTAYSPLTPQRHANSTTTSSLCLAAAHHSRREQYPIH